MKKKSVPKGVTRLGLILASVVVLLLIVAGSLMFGKDRVDFGGETIGPPPNDPVARKAWLSDKIKPMDKTTIILDEKLPTWRELDKLNNSLPEKTYPKYIKAVQTYGTLPNLVEVLYFGDDLADLGVNTQFIHASYWFKDGEFELWYQGYDKGTILSQDEARRALVHNILLARQLGLAVILFPDYTTLEEKGLDELGISFGLEERLEKIALELAPIAEKYKVEYLVPVNQIEMLFETNGFSIEEARRRTNVFYTSSVPKIKKVYSGKVMYKMGGFQKWSNYDGISLKGADVFGFTACLNRNRESLERVEQEIKTSSAKADELSGKYNVPWLNVEFVVSDQEYQVKEGKVPEKNTFEEYYKVGLNAFNKYGQNAKGFTIHSLLSTGKVYNTAVWPLVKDFFAAH
ncbi:hypothetical protein ACFLZP_02475 [Patescibacteria group bacterium]